MAVMIPADCDLNKRPFSERAVYLAVKESVPDEWYVFHSFDFVSRDIHDRRWDGEIDFLFYHPNYGILVLEVKGGAISHRAGQWFQDGRKIDPFGQAKRNKYAVLQLLEKSLGDVSNVKLAHAVCFPSCNSQTEWPAEADGLILTGDGLEHVTDFVRRVLDETPLPSHISGFAGRDDILRTLTPCFEYGKRLSEVIMTEEQQFFFFTNQQCAILNALENFRRLQVRGCAGSGKTIMALKKAKMLSDRGLKVLLLCYNQLLADHLRRETAGFRNIKAAAFFEYCIEQMNIPESQVGQYRSNPRLYSEVLPRLLTQYLSKYCLYYDAVIVDEGQDFSKEAWKVISLLPEENGYFYIFYDPDQNIFNEELFLPDFGLPPVELTKNCRNTRKIFSALSKYRSINAELADFAPDGSDIRVFHGSCRENLESELKRLISVEGINPADIVILGGHSQEHSSVADGVAGKYKIVPRPAVIGHGEISYFTYMKYKGCESKVVILLDVDTDDPRWRNVKGLYTAMSRAVHHLIILYKN